MVEEIGPQWDAPDPNGENLQARIDTSLINPIHIEIPLYSVNREARGVVVKYLQKHKLVTSPGIIRSPPSFSRFFDSETDTIFLPAADVAAFVSEPVDRIHKPNMQDRYVSFPRSALPRLAVTPAGLDVLKKDKLETFSVTAGGVDILYVVDTIPTGTFLSRDLENGRAFSLLGLGEASHVQLKWDHSRQEWVASGGDQEAFMRLQRMVGELENFASTTSQCDLDVQLVGLVAPSTTPTRGIAFETCSACSLVQTPAALYISPHWDLDGPTEQETNINNIGCTLACTVRGCTWR